MQRFRFLALILASATIAAARPLAAGTPCCAIVSIDAAAGLVTARTATGKTFRFKIGSAGPVDAFASKSGFGAADGFQPVGSFGPVVLRVGPVDALVNRIGPVDAAKILSSLKVGQKIWADLSGRVSINGLESCCGIVLSGITTH